MASSTCSTMASVVSTGGVTKVRTPQVSGELVADLLLGVNAITGSAVCRRASRRTVSPV